MHCITLESDNPFFNLAIEEILLKNSREEYLILGINKPSLIIGKHQSAHREANTRFVTENDIPVIRRISGGGTVFHDKGNLNFTFISNSEAGSQVDFRKQTKPVIDFLLTAGVEAKLENKSDLRVGAQKISGNAEHVHGNRVLHHGTILFNTSLDLLQNSIRKDKSHYSTRAVESKPTSVTNLIDITDRFRDINKLRSSLMDYIFNNISDANAYKLSESEKDKAESLAAEKYSTWDWNWAYGPEYLFDNSFVLNGKKCNCQLFVKDGIINKCSIEFNNQNSAISEKLTGTRHMVDDFLKVLREQDFLRSKEDIYNFF